MELSNDQLRASLEDVSLEVDNDACFDKCLKITFLCLFVNQLIF